MRMRRAFLAIVSVTALIIVGVFFYYSANEAQIKQWYYSEIAWRNPTQENFNKWAEYTSSSEYLKSNNIQDKGILPNSSFQYVSNWTQDQSKSEDVISLKTKDFETKQLQKNDISEVLDENMPAGMKIILPGNPGEIIQKQKYLYYKSSSNQKNKLIEESISTIAPVGQVEISGSKDPEEIKKELSKKYSSFLQHPNEALSDIFSNPEDNQINLNVIPEIVSMQIETDKTIIAENVEEIKIGETKLFYPGCLKAKSLNNIYSTVDSKIYFSTYNDFANNLCEPLQAGQFYESTCTDCKFYPASKQFKLSADYAPQVKSAYPVPGGHMIGVDAYNDMVEMYNAALSEGYVISITSGYRSYQTQVYTFEAWVQNELAQGYSRAAAEERANKYSARPGFSEHQLGTTVDLGSGGCSATHCYSTPQVWEWLKVNAYKYGFIMSYQEGKEAESGYIHEPWHYRWIGKEAAGEYNKVKDKYILRDWLVIYDKY